LFLLGVAIRNESAEAAVSRLINQPRQKRFIELEAQRILSCELPDAIDKLKEDGSAILISIIGASMSCCNLDQYRYTHSEHAPIHTESRLEHVASQYPFLFYENAKSRKGTVVRVHTKHGERNYLTGSIPTITTMH
jgi:hypothetical protein